MIPAQIVLYNLNNLEKPLFEDKLTKSQEILPKWSPKGEKLLLWCQTIHDETGNTYYGQHTLYELKENKLQEVRFYKGVIHDLQWSPDGQHFVLIGGGMPSHSVLFNSNCQPLYEFGRHHINKVIWNPYSHMIILGGFGNLSGDFEVWNVQNKVQVGKFNANCTVSCNWSLNGIYILCSVLFPKLRMGNNFKVFNYKGELLKVNDFSHTDLYDVQWIPYPFHQLEELQENKPQKLENQQQQEGDQQKKKGFLTKRGNLSSILNNDYKIANHNGKVLEPDEKFEREEDKEDEEKAKNAKNNANEKNYKNDFFMLRNKQVVQNEEKPQTNNTNSNNNNNHHHNNHNNNNNNHHHNNNNNSNHHHNNNNNSNHHHNNNNSSNHHHNNNSNSNHQHNNNNNNNNYKKQKNSNDNQQKQYQKKTPKKRDHQKQLSSGQGSPADLDDFFDQTDVIQEKNFQGQQVGNIQYVKKTL